MARIAVLIMLMLAAAGEQEPGRWGNGGLGLTALQLQLLSEGRVAHESQSFLG